jgi:hypothetical protein
MEDLTKKTPKKRRNSVKSPEIEENSPLTPNKLKKF